ncbi:hypothetical protein [Nocardioides ultimimeridianus]
MKWIGPGILLAAVLVVAGLWLYPIPVDHPTVSVRSCVPIREALRGHPDGLSIVADRCHAGAVERVRIGAFGGLSLGILGLGVLIGDRSSRSGRADAARLTDPSES